jgi:transcription termination factor Rho
MFENLTPLFPKEQMRLERDGFKGEENITGRVIDIIAPIGRGQRALLVAPPKSGKTVMMQHICARHLRQPPRGRSSWCCSSTSGPRK